MWRDIKDYEGLYEINENAVVRRVEGKGIDGRKVTTHVDFHRLPVLFPNLTDF